MSLLTIIEIVLAIGYATAGILSTLCAIKKGSSRAEFVGTKWFLLSTMGFCALRLLFFIFTLLMSRSISVVGTLPILKDSVGYSAIIDGLCNLFFVDLMIRFVRMSLHTANAHPLISVVNEKTDVFVSTIWPIVLLSISSVATVLCYMLKLISWSIMVYILASLFSIVYILLISRWIQYYQHAKQITQNALISISDKRKEIGFTLFWVSAFILPCSVRVVGILFTAFIPISSFVLIGCFLVIVELIPLLVALADVLRTLDTAASYQPYFDDIIETLGNIISV